MSQTYIQDESFDKIDFTQKPLPRGEYENCIFSNCDFSNNDFSAFRFNDCEFDSCNLSLVKLNNTLIQDVRFRNCKMLGMLFDTCDEFGLSYTFDNCILNNSSFYKRKMKKTIFKDTQLKEVDFAECDLSGVVFNNCDLSGALFDHTMLEKADLRTSYNYSIDPDINRIKKAKFSLAGLPGLLSKYGIMIE